MLYTLTFEKDFRCFKKGDTVEFHPGVNLLVGDQGTGKSSLLQAIAAASKAKTFPYPLGLEKSVTVKCDRIRSGGFDFEKNNYRTKSHLDDNISFHLATMFSSHGQVNMAVLRSLSMMENSLFFLDEPDMSLSIRSIIELIRILKQVAERGCQIIAAVQHPFLIQAFPEVYSCEHRKWMNSEEFVKTQLGGVAQLAGGA